MSKINELGQEIKDLRKQLEAYYRNDHQVIAKLDHKLNELEIKLEKAEEEAMEEDEPTFDKVQKDDWYFYIKSSTVISVSGTRAGEDARDNARFTSNNYFHTEKRAQEVADKINFLLRLERLHDTYCPDYVPDWNDEDAAKYYVYWEKRYMYSIVRTFNNKCMVCFPTKEIAQKVCDILNEELKTGGKNK